MKLSAVYSSPRKADTYLYVENKNDFSKVPEALLKQFGQPKFVMLVPLAKRHTLANLPTATFIEKLKEDGFYLQLPPPPTNLLKAHKKAMSQRFSSEKPDE